MSQAEGNYLLRQKQYKISPEEELFISKKIVSNKIVNQSKILKYYEKLSPSYKITQVIEKVTNAKDLNELLGIEGLFAKEYFRLLFSDFDWYRRAPRTKEDVNNLLLDIGYTFLFNYVDTLLNLFGFDTYKGVYHQLFFQRKSLSCDIMEPFRPLIEKGLCKAYNLNQVNEADFMFSNGQYSFKQYELRRKYLNIWTSVIVEAKEALYTYVLNYYRYISNPDKYKFPEFVIR
jgi:CRISPR-associated protein Cas1